MSKNVAVDNARTYCGQRKREVCCNWKPNNELGRSAWKSGDDAKGSTDTPNCEGRFQHVIIDSFREIPCQQPE